MKQSPPEGRHTTVRITSTSMYRQGSTRFLPINWQRRCVLAWAALIVVLVLPAASLNAANMGPLQGTYRYATQAAFDLPCGFYHECDSSMYTQFVPDSTGVTSGAYAYTSDYAVGTVFRIFEAQTGEKFTWVVTYPDGTTQTTQTLTCTDSANGCWSDSTGWANCFGPSLAGFMPAYTGYVYPGCANTNPSAKPGQWTLAVYDSPTGVGLGALAAYQQPTGESTTWQPVQFPVSHNPPGPLGITSPTDNQLFDLNQQNYTASGTVPFSANTSGGGSISWTASLQYKTSGGYGVISDSRPFTTASGQEHDETYQSTGGQVKATARTTLGDGSIAQDCVTFYVEGPVGGIPDPTITSQLDSLYQQSQSYPSGGTPNLMTGVAMRESSYHQFLTPAEGNSDLFQLYAKFDLAAKWPFESPGGGKYIGLMQILNAANQQSDPNAWKWADPTPAAAANANDAVNLFSGSVSPNKMTIALGYETNIINGVKNPKIPGHVGLNWLTGSQLEDMALVLYGGWVIGCGTSLTCLLNSQYYIPQCPPPGVQATNKQGNLTCSTGWQWVPNAANQAAGLNYVKNGTNGVRDRLQ